MDKFVKIFRSFVLISLKKTVRTQFTNLFKSYSHILTYTMMVTLHLSPQNNTGKTKPIEN